MISDMSLTSAGTAGTNGDISDSGSGMGPGQGLAVANGQGPEEINHDAYAYDEEDHREIDDDVLLPPSPLPPSPSLPPVDSFTISDVRTALIECCGRTDGYLQEKYQPYPNRLV